jgi:hypothetical protein
MLFKHPLSEHGCDNPFLVEKNININNKKMNNGEKIVNNEEDGWNEPTFEDAKWTFKRMVEINPNLRIQNQSIDIKFA